MSDQAYIPNDPLTDHEYDGIREYDNPTPGWWHAFFWITIIFSAVYLLVWHVSIAGKTIQESWADDQKEEFARVFGAVGQLKPDEPTILQQMSNPQFMAIARGAFISNCAPCHSREGGGGIVGVNLCDDAYKNITQITDLYRVITEGAAGGAMPSWKARLSDNERVIVASYVASLRGTSPPNPKGPEGTVIPPWPKAPTTPGTPATPAAPATPGKK